MHRFCYGFKVSCQTLALLFSQSKFDKIKTFILGGPGDSSLSGLFNEVGPYTIRSDQRLVLREYSWHLKYNVIFIDNPVGTGFSFTDSDAGYSKNLIDVGQNVLKALQQFFLLFPHLQNNEFYLTGESYAGFVDEFKVSLRLH